MNSINKFFLQPFRFLAVFLMCALLILTTADLTFASEYVKNNGKSEAPAGVVQLDQIEKRSEEVARGGLSAEDYQARAQEGINEVQGAADVNQMKRPENSKNVPTVLDQIEKGLDKVTDKG